jgi:hypothetical protein
MKAVKLAVFGIALTTYSSVICAQDSLSVPAPDTSYADYHESPVSLPLGLGLRIPTYDRINGLALPWGPKLETSDGKFDIDGLVTYRSNLGKFDPSIEGVIRPAGSQELRLYAGRGTVTNDKWIRDDLTNSATALFAGSDARNWFRADRATVRYAGTITGKSVTVTPFFGGNMERDWSTGSNGPPPKSPWAFYGHTSDKRMRRPNPAVSRGHIASLLGGAAMDVVSGGLNGTFNLNLEQSLRTNFDDICFATPGGLFCGVPSGVSTTFTQMRLDARLMFPTFGSQTFTFHGHTVLTGGAGIAPAQRFAYLGGVNTLSSVELLALGGDQLLFVMGEYRIPFERIQVPFLGNPFLALNYAAGNAGPDNIPALIQNLGVGVGIGVLRFDYTLDPSHNRSPFSRRNTFSFGLSLSP